MMESLLETARRQRRELERRVALAQAQAALAVGSVVIRGRQELDRARQQWLESPSHAQGGAAADGSRPVRRQAPALGSPHHPLAFLDRSPVAKGLLGMSASVPTQVPGAVLGLARTLGDAVDLVRFGGRLADPEDEAKSPPGESARDQLARTARGAANYVARGVRHPDEVMDDLGGALRDEFHATNLWETAGADSLADAFMMGIDKGLNIGEGAAALAGPGKGGRALMAGRTLSYAEHVEKFVQQGWSREIAEHLAQPYDGMGHHYLPRRLLRRWGVPEVIGNSVFNVRKPAGMTIGDFYADHFRVDPYFHGTGLPGRRGRGSGWSGRKLNLKKHGRLGRVILGAPEALQDTAIGLGSGLEAAVADGLDPEE